MPFDRAAYDLARYHRTRQECLKILGGVCADCGSTSDLQFDHADSATKEYEISRLMCGYSRELLMKELAKCLLRCPPCHLEKSSRAGDDHSVPHGGGKSGKKNCKCRPCIDRKNEYMRNWKKQRKGL